MEKIKCDYPGCKKEYTDTHFLELINKEGETANMPFCRYHFYIVMGGHFKAKFIGGDDFELVGPLKEVEIAEQVMGARELIKKLKNDDKGLKAEKPSNKKS